MSEDFSSAIHEKWVNDYNILISWKMYNLNNVKDPMEIKISRDVIIEFQAYWNFNNSLKFLGFNKHVLLGGEGSALFCYVEIYIGIFALSPVQLSPLS